MNPYSKAYFIKSSANISQLGKDEGYEIAFAGRSNAGKSSAINCLTGVKLARTSKLPGRTRLINSFYLDPERRLIDLPGYGYAKVGQQIKKDWQTNLAQYLEARQCLRGLILLMDCRHPCMELDQKILNWAVMRQLPVHILLTKIDKLSRSAAKNTLSEVKNHFLFLSHLISMQVFSSLKKEGVEELIKKLNEWYEW